MLFFIAPQLIRLLLSHGMTLEFICYEEVWQLKISFVGWKGQRKSCQVATVPRRQKTGPQLHGEGAKALGLGQPSGLKSIVNMHFFLCFFRRNPSK